MRTEINSQDMNEYLNEQNTKIMQYIGPICQHQFENLHTYIHMYVAKQILSSIKALHMHYILDILVELELCFMMDRIEKIWHFSTQCLKI